MYKEIIGSLKKANKKSWKNYITNTILLEDILDEIERNINKTNGLPRKTK